MTTLLRRCCVCRKVPVTIVGVEVWVLLHLTPAPPLDARWSDTYCPECVQAVKAEIDELREDIKKRIENE